MESADLPPETNNQTNIHGDLSTDGGLVNTGTINTGGAPVIGRDQIIIHQRLDPADLRNQRNHAVLRQAVRRFWVDGVLKGSLYNEVRIRLGLDAHPEAVDNRPWNLTLHQTGKPDRTIAHDKEIVDIFGEMGQQLLILGEPGSGKTTTLLTLADELLIRTEQDPTLPTPVVFNLSSWAETQPKLEEWLVDELKSRYQMPGKVAAGWVENDELLLLLDGLDEVAEAKRNGCVNAINAFRQEHLVGLAICSRTAEYTALTAQLKVAGAVAVRPLTTEQIDDYLEKTSARADRLKQALADSDELRELAQTPLMLSVLTLAYQEQNSIEPAQQTTGRTIRQQLLDRYIQRMFQHRDIMQLYSAHRTVSWLHWLAAQMVERSQTTFLIEHLQMDWLANQRTVNFYQLIARLSFGLVGGLSFGLMAGRMAGLMAALMAGLIGGLTFGSDSNYSDHIAAHESLNFSWKSGLGAGLVVGLVVGLFVMLLEWLLSWLIGDLSVGLVLSVGLSVGLIFGLAGWLVVGLSAGISGERRTSKAKVKTRDNQGIWRAFRNGLTGGLILGLMGGTMGGLGIVLHGGLLDGLVIGLVGGSIGGLFGGLDQCIKHFILRSLLYRGRRMPWNYARFLDYAASRLFLRKVGGSYLFVHRLIMEHFASLTDADIERITADLK